jgi:3-oxoacyl-[acyl-carrier protein] reductase
MDLGLEGKVAVVAAASGGLGYAVALELAREGAAVAIASRDTGRIAAAAERLRGEVAKRRGGEPEILPMAADLNTAAGAERCVRDAEERFGRVDILVANNAGPPPGSPLLLDDAAWQAGFEGTFLSSRRLAAAAIPGMRRRRWGRIVFITSTSVKQPIGDLAVSTALRSAVVGLAKTLADELAAEGITVNCVAPGSTLTERLQSLLETRARKRGITPEDLAREMQAQIPARRFGRPEEFAAAVAFLASERSSYITGVVLAVDGGLVRSLT